LVLQIGDYLLLPHEKPKVLGRTVGGGELVGEDLLEVFQEVFSYIRSH
jgi:hypothetical protein